MPIRSIAILILALVAGHPATAQPGPVEWSVRAESGPVTPGGLLTVTVQGEIEDGWRVYAMDSAGGHALEVAFEAPEGARPLGSPQQAQPLEGFDKWFESEYTFFSDHVTLTQAFRIGEEARGNLSLVGTITYMACSDEVCLPARQEKVHTSFRVAHAGR